MNRRTVLGMAGVVGSSMLIGCLGFADDAGGDYQWRYDAGGELDVISQGVVFGREQSNGQVVALDAPSGERRWTYGEASGMDTYSELAVTETDIYFGYCTDEDCSGLYALDRDGEERWRDDTVGTGRTSPFVIDGIVYVASDVGVVRAFDAETGRNLWTDRVDESANITSGSKIIDITNAVYVEKNADLVALDRDKGNRLWQYDPGDEDTQIIDVTVSDGVAYVATAEWVAAVADGDELWRRTFEGSEVDVQTEIMGIASKRLFVLVNTDQHESRLYAFAVTNGDRDLVLESIEHPNEESDPLVTVHDAVIYVGTDRLRAFDAATGSERWSVTIDGGPVWSMTVVESNGTGEHAVFIRAGANRIVSVDSSGERTWERSVDGRISDYLVSESVFVATNEQTFAFEWQDDS